MNKKLTNNNKVGFTLIELIVIVFITGVVITWISVNYSHNTTRLSELEFSEKFKNQVESIRLQAILNQKKIEFKVNENEYFFEFADNTKRSLYKTKLELDKKNLIVFELNRPSYFYSNGEIDPFTLKVNNQEWHFPDE